MVRLASGAVFVSIPPGLSQAHFSLANRRIGRRFGFGLRLRRFFSKPPVENDRFTEGAKNDVRRLQIAMNNAAFVGVGDRLARSLRTPARVRRTDYDGRLRGRSTRDNHESSNGATRLQPTAWTKNGGPSSGAWNSCTPRIEGCSSDAPSWASSAISSNAARPATRSGRVSLIATYRRRLWS